MPYRKIQFLAGEYYHLYNRGHNYQPIFFERANYLYFLQQIRKYLAPTVVEIIAYCLMPNHYHLLVHLATAELSKVMLPFVLSYTKAINKRYGRAGTLFQGRFKAIYVDREEYLLHLSRYIHLNPVRASLVEHPEDWEFSSYREYVGLRNGTLPQTKMMLSLLSAPTPLVYQAFVEDYIAEDENVIEHLTIDERKIEPRFLLRKRGSETEDRTPFLGKKTGFGETA